LIQLGQTSLLVYWVHIEFVYGRFSILTKRAQDIRTASFGLLAIFLAMLLLSALRTRAKTSAVARPALQKQQGTTGPSTAHELAQAQPHTSLGMT